MASDKRRDAATTLTGAAALAGGGKLRHAGVTRAVQGGKYPRVHLAAILKPRAHGRYLYAGGTLLGLAGTAATAQGLTNLVRTEKRDKKPLWQEGLGGTKDALKGRSESLRTSQPADLRATTLGVGAAAGGLGAMAARLALRKHPALKPWLSPVAGGVAATASLPATAAVVRRNHPDYQVTPTGVRRKKDLVKKPSTQSFTARTTTRSLRADVGKADSSDYLGARTSYRAQRAAVTAAGGVPIIGPLAQARQAARYAPPGQERKTAVRQFAYGPLAGAAAGVGGAYAGATLAAGSARVARHAESLVEAKTRAGNALRRKVGMKPAKVSVEAATTGWKAHRLSKPVFGSKARMAGAAVGFAGAKGVTGLAGGQKAISDSQRDQAAYNARHRIAKLDPLGTKTKREQHQLARTKRTNATLSVLGGTAGLTGLALLPTKHKAGAVYASTVGGGIGGLNALIGAKVQRREAKHIDPVKKGLPTHAIHSSFGKVRVLHQHSKDHFMVLTNRDEKRLLHRDTLTFTNHVAKQANGMRATDSPIQHRGRALKVEPTTRRLRRFTTAQTEFPAFYNDPVRNGASARLWDSPHITRSSQQVHLAEALRSRDKASTVALSARRGDQVLDQVLRHKGGQRVALARVRVIKREPVAITGSKEEHKALVRQYGDRGPLPAGLDRDTKMRAYEARYVHAGGDKSEKWNRRANVAEGSRNAALATGTAGLAGLAALKHPKVARKLAKHPRLGHRLDATALTAGAVGGASEIYGEYARHRRASYANSPGGVARSALVRMRSYTPQD